MISTKCFVDAAFHNFNAGTLKNAAKAYVEHVESGGKMLITLAGAMSTARIGFLLAEMIRNGKVHAICSTGANLEEDLLLLLAGHRYANVDARESTAFSDTKLLNGRYNRVADVAIPEDAINALGDILIPLWDKAYANRTSDLPHRYINKAITLGKFPEYDTDASWVLAAYEAGIPIYVPGWADSSLGNIFVARALAKRDRKYLDVVLSDTHYMIDLVQTYQRWCKTGDTGLFQIGGGIAGDFPICVVPLINQDYVPTEKAQGLRVCDVNYLTVDEAPVKPWRYFCQVTDAVESYGGYSGAAPSEKISWGKFDADTEYFSVNSDATIVAPLIFAYVLGW